MPDELETDNSENVELFEDTPEVIEPEDEIVAKNRQLYERAKKAEQKAKELEEQLAGQSTVSDPYEDEDLRSKVNELSQKLATIEEKSHLDALVTQYPVLQEKFAEFDEYRTTNPGMSIQTAAKAYLAEHDLLGQTPKRKGLEKAGGGQRTPPTGKMTTDDAKRLRENNYTEYKKLLMAGKIQF
jgi:hypothetical protein